MKSPIRHLLLAVLLAGLAAASICRADVLSFSVPEPVTIPETGSVPIILKTPTAPAISTLNSVTVSISHRWLGDLTAKLVTPSGAEFILFDRVGEPPDGSPAMLGLVTPSSDPNGDPFALAPGPYQFAASGSDFAAAAQTAADNETWNVPTTATYRAQTWGAGPFASGVWQLVVSDAADQDGGEISGAQLDYTTGATPPPDGIVELNWPFPADINYGTPLGPTQLNATASVGGNPVAGVYAYLPPTGTVLPAGAQTLSVTFTPLDPVRYKPVTATIPIQVRPVPLTVTADSKSMVYGAVLPTLTATYNGFVNGDTPASLAQPVTLSTTATLGSPAGTYPISLSGGASPNYILTRNNGVLTVTQATLTLTITADNKTKVYGAPVPPLTATYTGFVNGDGPGNLMQPITLTTTATAASPVGTYPISISGGSIGNYNIVLVGGVLTVTPATLLVTADTKSKVYGAPLPPLTASYSGFVNGDTAARLTQPITLATPANESSPVGAYPITIAGGAIPNYNIVLRGSTLTTTPATLLVTTDDKTIFYGSAFPVFTGTYSGFVNGDSVASLTEPVRFSTSATSTSPVGTYPIIAVGGASPNYVLILTNGLLTITKATLILTVTADNKTKVFGAPVPTLTATYSGFAAGDSPASLTQPVVLSTSATARSPVGTYPITCTGGASTNYLIVVKGGSLTVTPAPLVIAADDKTIAYGDALPEFTASYSSLVASDTVPILATPITFSTTARQGSPVGVYSITVSGGASPNYTLTYKPGTLLIARAVLTVTADDKSKVYGAPLPAFTATYRGFVNGDTPASLSQPISLTTVAEPGSPVGQHQIRVSGGASANYNVVLNNGVLTITKAPLLVTADNLAKTYGTALPTLTASYSGFVSGDTAASLTAPVTLSCAATTSSPPGTYPVVISGGDSANYALTLRPGVLQVTPAPLTVTPQNKSKAYGAALPILSATFKGFVNGDTQASLTQPLVLVTTATASSPVGTYPITLASGGSPNYNLIVNTAVLTVTKATLEVSAEPKSKTYGAALPTLTATYNGFVNGDSPSSLTQPVVLATAANPASPVGTYPITLSGGDSPDYNLVLTGSTLSITPAPLTVTADDKTLIYGASLPALTATFRGFLNDDTATSLTQPVTLTTTATPGSPTGTYPIVVTGGASPNYFLVYNNGVLTVTRATLTLTVSADQKSKVYGAPVPPLTATYSGFVNGDTPASLTQPVTLTTTATARSPVGTYPITVSGGASPTYALVLNAGTLTVTPAPLTVTPDAKTKTYGAALPTFTASYSGLVNGDTAASLTQPLTFATSARSSSPVGTYPITVSGGGSPNYTLSYKTGALLVARAVLTVTAEDKTKLYGDPLPALTARYKGFVNGDTAASLTQPISLSTIADSRSAVGQHQIRVSGGASPNYNLVLNNGVLTVTAAPLTITADNATTLYGRPVPILTASYSGFVNGDTAASLTRPPVLTTAVTPTSPAGTYPITVSGAEAANYAIRFVNGTLTVIDSGANPQCELTGFSFGQDGSVNIRVSPGNGSSQVRLEWSDDLLTWKPITTMAAADGETEFQIQGLAKVRLRFFRAVPAP